MQSPFFQMIFHKSWHSEVSTFKFVTSSYKNVSIFKTMKIYTYEESSALTPFIKQPYSDDPQQEQFVFWGYYLININRLMRTEWSSMVIRKTINRPILNVWSSIVIEWRMNHSILTKWPSTFIRTRINRALTRRTRIWSILATAFTYI